jgi:hypothetical protein
LFLFFPREFIGQICKGDQAQASRAPLNLYKILCFDEYYGLCMLKLQLGGFKPQPPPFSLLIYPYFWKKNKKKKEGRGFEPKTSRSKTIEKKPAFTKN